MSGRVRLRRILIAGFISGLLVVNGLSIIFVYLEMKYKAEQISKLVRNDIILGDYRSATDSIRMAMDGFESVRLESPDGQVIFSLLESSYGWPRWSYALLQSVSVSEISQKSNHLKFEVNLFKFVRLVSLAWLILGLIQWAIVFVLRGQIEEFYRGKMEQENLSRLGALVRQIAHDLRSPLSFLKIVEKKMVWPDRELLVHYGKALNVIENSLEQTLNSVSHSPSAKVPVAIMSFIEAEIRRKKQEYQERMDVHLKFDLVQVTRDLYVNINPLGLSSIISNLINNAIEALQGESIFIEISVSESGSWFFLKIRDNGKGMAPEVLKKLEKRRFTTKEKGHGLGLSSARTLIKEWGGRLDIISTLGSGTTVTICLPKT